MKPTILPENIIFSCVSGSRLYGTHNDNSDYDIKTVFVSPLNDLIFRAEDTERYKSEADNTETELFSIHKFSRLLSQNQPVSLELLFCPKQFMLSFSTEWEELTKNTDKIVSKHILPFIGYAKNQGYVYSEKGNKLVFLRKLKQAIFEFMKQNNVKGSDKCEGLVGHLKTPPSEELYSAMLSGHLNFLTNGKVTLIQVLGKSTEETCTITTLLTRIDTLIDSFGNRALLAEQNEGVDYKAMYHAVRVIHEAIELLETGRLTFPRPELELLLKIRKEEYSFSYIANLIQDKLVELDETLVTSTLREKPDNEFIANWMLTVQKQYLLKEITN